MTNAGSADGAAAEPLMSIRILIKTAYHFNNTFHYHTQIDRRLMVSV